MFKKALKTIATVGMSASLLFGATFGISACGSNENTHDNPSISTPVDPEKPDDKTPSKPENPTNPDTPTNPENPTNPTNPENPTNPDMPVNPENPGENDPNKKPDEQKPEEPVFELNATTKKTILEKLKPTIDELCYNCYGYKDPVLQQAYLRPSESGVVDTLGCVMATNDGEGILYSEIKVLKLKEDLTWEKINKSGIGISNYNVKNCAITTIFNLKSKISKIENYDDSYVDDAFKKAFNINDQAFNSALFTGWKFEEGPRDVDHYLTYICGNTIYQRVLKVNNSGLDIFNAFIKNFIESKTNENWKELEHSQTQLMPEEYAKLLVDFGTKESQAENQ